MLVTLYASLLYCLANAYCILHWTVSVSFKSIQNLSLKLSENIVLDKHKISQILILLTGILKIFLYKHFQIRSKMFPSTVVVQLYCVQCHTLHTAHVRNKFNIYKFVTGIHHKSTESLC